jgi:Lon protease-like protein
MTLSHLTLPYHIFESRYRKMLEMSLTRSVPISVLPPSLHPFVGAQVFAGVPRLMHQHEDGRSDIVISGDFRVKVLKIYEEDEYLVADVEEITLLSPVTKASHAHRELIREALEFWVDQQKIEREQKKVFVDMLEQEECLLLSYGLSLLVKSDLEKVVFLKCESWDEWAKLLVKKIGPTELSLGPYLTKLKF